MVVGEGLLTLRASPFGSLPAATLSRWRSVEPWSKLLILPRLGRIFNCGSFESSRTFESDGGGGRITQPARFALRVVACGNALSLALKRTLVEASHPSPLGQNI